MQLILVALGRRAAFEIADIGAFVRDDERALELPGLRRVDAEIGGKLHRAAHAFRHIDERSVGKHRRIERREEIVGDGNHGAQIFAHQVAVVADRLGDRTEYHAGFGKLRLEGGHHRNRIEDGVNGDTREQLLLVQRNAELLVSLEQLGIDLVETRETR